MSYNQNMNVGAYCPPGGVACPTPMALPSYSAVRSQPIPMPIQQPVNLPQQQFGIVGGPSTYTPPPAVSYAPHYVCYNAGNQSYNNTLGTLANIIIGAIYSTPMSGGNTPGQLSTTGAMMPYANYTPPGQCADQQYDMNKQYQSNCAPAPAGFAPQPHPVQAGASAPQPHPAQAGGCAPTSDCAVEPTKSYKKSKPLQPRGPMAYDCLFDGSKPTKTEGTQKKGEKQKVKSEQWEGSVSNGKGLIKISDRYEIKLNESNSEWVVYDKQEKKTTTIWGDPHISTEANGQLDFKKTMTFVLEDGTKITVRNTPRSGGDESLTLSSELYITNGDKSMKVTGLANKSDAKTDDGNLSIVTSLTNGVAVDKMIDDGALSAYQVGDLWVNSATGKQLTQSQIDSAESCYNGEEDNETAYKGSDKKDDELKGTKNDDRYIATDGDDEFDGGDGVDTAVFSGDIEDYKIERLSNGRISVEDDDGNKTILKNVEQLEFNGKKYNITVDGIGDKANDGLADNDESRLIVFGEGGDDTFTLEAGSKTKYFDGGAGTDTVVLSGKKDDFEFEEGEDDTIIVKDEASGKVLAVLSNVEKVKFSDGSVVDASTLI